MPIDEKVLAGESIKWPLTPELEEETVRLFLRTTNQGQDDLNILIVLNALRGLKTVERDEYGIPLEILREFNFPGWIALYSGIGMLNEADMKKMSGLPFGKLIKSITELPYVSGKGEGLAANALFELMNRKVGYIGEKAGVEARMNAQNNGVKLQTLRSLYIPRITNFSFPPRGEYARYSKPGKRRENAVAMTYEEREDTIRQLLQALKSKGPKPYIINPDGMFREGWIAPSESKKGHKEYFVQRGMVNILGSGEHEIYNCACPAGLNKLLSANAAKVIAAKPCKHIVSVQQKYAA